MRARDAVKLNRWMSLVYAGGVWTMIGSLAYYKHTGRFDGFSGGPTSGNSHLRTFERAELSIKSEQFIKCHGEGNYHQYS